MRTTTDVIRTAFAAVLGLVASVAATMLLLQYTHVIAVPAVELPHALTPRALLFVGAPMIAAGGLAWIYATWFDHLLVGPAIARGLKFGAIAWLWLASIVALVRMTSGLGMSWSTHVHALVALASVVPCLVYGAVLGVVYGTGRVYDDYRSGLGYGVTDRRSLG